MASPKIPIYFSPQAGEDLHSWLIRISAAHGLSMTNFLEAIFPDKNDMGIGKIVRDVTNIPKEETVLQLSQATGVSFEDLVNSSFLPEEGIFPDKQFAGEQILHNLIRPNRPYCPLCFADNAISFHKKDWRLKFNVRCRVHDQIFLDGCPHCGWDDWLYIHPHLMGSNHLSEDFFRYCPHCKNNLGEAEKQIESLSGASKQLATEVMDLCTIALAAPLEKFTYGKSPPIAGRDFLDMVSYFSKKLASDREWMVLAKMVSSEIGLPHPVSERTHDWTGISQTLFDLCQIAAAGWLIGRSAEQLISINEANWRVIFPIHNHHRGAKINYPQWMNSLFTEDYIPPNSPYPSWKNFDAIWVPENH